MQKAGLVLGVSPSAVSRTIKQLEDALNEPVFERRPTGVSLTPRGQALLRATRDAMRTIDDSLAPRAEATRVGVVGPFLTVPVAEALAGLAGPIRVTAISTVEVGAALRRGDVDTVIAHAPVDDDTVQVDVLGGMPLVIAAETNDRSGVLVGWHGVTAAAAHLTHTAPDLAGVYALAHALGAAALVPENRIAPPFRLVRRSEWSLPVVAVTRRPLVSSPTPASWLARLRAALA